VFAKIGLRNFYRKRYLKMLVEEAIERRKSIRNFTNEPLSKENIDKLLWAGSKCPSAGGIHPCRIYVVDDEILREKLCVAALNQKSIKEAPVVLVLVADFSRMVKRYHRRGYRYIYMEAGHMGQNISLMAVTLGLGSVMIGAFRDEEVKKVLNIKEEPLYLIPVGRMNAVQTS